MVPVSWLLDRPRVTVSPEVPLKAWRRLRGMDPVKSLPSRLWGEEEKGAGGREQTRQQRRETTTALGHSLALRGT